MLGSLIFGLVLIQVHSLDVTVEKGSCPGAAHVPAAGLEVAQDDGQKVCGLVRVTLDDEPELALSLRFKGSAAFAFSFFFLQLLPVKVHVVALRKAGHFHLLTSVSQGCSQRCSGSDVDLLTQGFFF